MLCTIRRDLNPRGRDRKRECHANIRAGHGLKATVYGMFQNQQFFFIFGTLLDVSLGFYVIKSLNCNYFFKKNVSTGHNIYLLFHIVQKIPYFVPKQLIIKEFWNKSVLNPIWTGNVDIMCVK